MMATTSASGADIRVRVCGLGYQNEIGQFERTYASSTPISVVKKDAWDHFAHSPLQPQLPLHKICLLHGGSQLDEGRPL